MPPKSSAGLFPTQRSSHPPPMVTTLTLDYHLRLVIDGRLSEWNHFSKCNDELYLPEHLSKPQDYF